MRAALLGLVVVSACGGTARPKPGDPPTDPLVKPHATTCWWAGDLTVTMAPTRGDATCVQSRPIEVELEREAPLPEAGLVVMMPPASTGTSADGLQVSIQGDIEGCAVTMGVSSAQDPASKRGMFLSVGLQQDLTTRRVTGRGTATVFCSDDSCHCEAEITVDGSIAVK